MRPVPVPVTEKLKAMKAEQPKREKIKADPVLVAKARELRDRYLEQFNSPGLVLPSAKYEVARQVDAKAPAAPLLLEQAGELSRAA